MAQDIQPAGDRIVIDVPSQPYAPSWVDRLAGWVRRRLRASWFFYTALAVILLALQTSVVWVEGALPVWTFLPPHIFLAIVCVLFPGLIQYLDGRAASALESLRPALMVKEAGYSEIRRMITTLPARMTLMAGVLAVLFALLTEAIGGGAYGLEALDRYPVSAAMLRVIYLLCWWLFGTFVYHTIHQLRGINRIYTRYTRINLFRMKPLYAFSSLMALTAGSLTVITYIWLLINPDVSFSDPVVLVSYIMIFFLAIVTFLLPQLGIHRLQVEEKERLHDEANQRYEKLIAQLHQCVDNGELEAITSLNVAISSIELEIATIKRISTWPWQPETVRWLVTALVFPLGAWLLQYLLQRLIAV